MIRWGILGTAKIACEALIPAVLAANNAVLAAVASRDPDRGQVVARRFGAIHSFDSYEAMLNSDVIDAVYIPLPSAMHVEWSKRAAEMGKHVLCEKPIAMRAEQIEELMATSAQHQALISEAFMVHYHPQWAFARQALADIGQLRQVQAVFCYHNTDPDNMRNQSELGGGGLPDIGVYPTFVTRLVTGSEPQRARARIDWDPRFKTDRFANCELAFEGFDLNFYCSTQMALQQRISFHGENGEMVLNAPFNPGPFGAAEVQIFDRGRNQVACRRFADVNQYRMQVEVFSAAIQNKDWSAVVCLENSKRNQLAIDALYQSDQQGGQSVAVG